MATRTTTIAVRDGKGQTATIEYDTPDTAGIITTVELAEEVALAIDVLIGGIVTGISVVTNVDIPSSLEEDVDADSDVEEGAKFTFRAANGGDKEMRLPTFDEQFLLAGTKQVDLADSDVDAFVDLMINGRTDIVNGNVAPVSIRNSDLVSLISAKENFKPRAGN